MTQPNSLYLVIKSFIDRSGNTYQSRKEPYQYGELPTEIRDNTVFCVPFTQLEIQEQVLTPEPEVKITEREENKPITHKAKMVKTTYIKKNDTAHEE